MRVGASKDLVHTQKTTGNRNTLTPKESTHKESKQRVDTKALSILVSRRHLRRETGDPLCTYHLREVGWSQLTHDWPDRDCQCYSTDGKEHPTVQDK